MSLKQSKLFYFLYFITKTKWGILLNHLSYVSKTFGKSKIFVFFDVIQSSFTYKSSFHEYFYYKFYELTRQQRSQYATAGLMFEYQLKMNPVKHRYLIEDKVEFLKKYNNYSGREWIDLQNSNKAEADAFIKAHSKFVLKNSKGQAGQDIKVMKAVELTEPLLQFAKKNNFDLIEQFVVQHTKLMELSPESLNTIRVITQVNNNGDIDFLGATLRLGLGSDTDNLSTGGIALPLNIEKGYISGPGVSFNITAKDVYEHPVSKIQFLNFEIPYWAEILQITQDAALLYPQNKSIGWDVAIKQSGPILIEGNHNWGARLWQMPYKTGFKSRIINYLK